MKFFKSILSDNSKFKSIDNDIIRKYNKTRNSKSKKYLCYAPFKSLTFFIGGDIMVCWHNKQYLLGHYPEDSIKEIWFGKKAEIFREHIINNDLSLGCAECLRHIETNNYNLASTWRYDYLSGWSSKYPVTMDFQISNICNLECIMCNGEFSISVRQHREMENPYINPYDSNFINQLDPFIPHLKEANFSGGEAFLINQYFEIWEKIYNINPSVKISVTSNSTVLNDRIKKILEKLRFNFTISIDSVNKETYEKIRKNASFEETFYNFDYYLEYTKRKKTFFSVRICPLRQNWKEIPEIINFLNKKDVESYFNTVIFPPYSSLWNLKSDEINEIVNYLSGFRFENNTKNQKQNNQNYENLIKQLKDWYKEAILREIEYPFIETFETEKLKNILFTKVFEYINNSKSFKPEEQKRFNLFFELAINTCQNEIKDIEQYKLALCYYISLPINRLVDEFNIRSLEKIINFTKQAGRTF